MAFAACADMIRESERGWMMTLTWLFVLVVSGAALFFFLQRRRRALRRRRHFRDMQDAQARANDEARLSRASHSALKR